MSSFLPSSSNIAAADLAAAAERRLQQRQAASPSELQFSGAEHDLRQKFRRLIQPGILGRNADAQALASLKTLLTIAENLLNDFDNEKFRQFKPTNPLIKRNIIDPKGTVEYARELGFNPEVRDYQPYYTFNPRKKDHLRIGAEILRAQFELLEQKEARASQAKKEEKAVAAAAAEKVRLAYEDDRKKKMLFDELEKERRQARIAAAAAREAATREAAPPDEEDADGDEDDEDFMPGSGNVLGQTSHPSISVSSNKKTD
ncbi:PUB domain-containing protein [Favolaschia claudopus]|uniref:PUB domain-containing protein n=1 Tax=Favolaschia claudopus TaxID=2862362 RepID=A0AAW0DSN0_9AGAR